MTDYIKTLRKSVGHAPIILCGASVILVNADGEILLQKRQDNGCWCFHGGAVELDEVVEEAAKRELFEETGLVANSLELFNVFSGADMHYVYPNGDEVSIVDIVYICRDYSGELTAEQNEVSELRFFTIDELPDKISPPQRRPLRTFVEQMQSNIIREQNKWN
ncbi:ADP-ribose pyrophosphatase [Clostridia bacterium]|nr:ADP-ribose pyrophosphatase [Clostridia bacterium]